MTFDDNKYITIESEIRALEPSKYPDSLLRDLGFKNDAYTKEQLELALPLVASKEAQNLLLGYYKDLRPLAELAYECSNTTQYVEESLARTMSRLSAGMKGGLYEFGKRGAKFTYPLLTNRYFSMKATFLTEAKRFLLWRTYLYFKDVDALLASGFLTFGDLATAYLQGYDFSKTGVHLGRFEKFMTFFLGKDKSLARQVVLGVA